MSDIDVTWTDDDEEAFVRDIQWRIESVMAGIHPADAAVTLADMAEWLLERSQVATEELARSMGIAPYHLTEALRIRHEG